MLVIALAGALWFPALASAKVLVERQKVKVERKTFDPRRPPADMPKLTGAEAAVTVSKFGVQTSIRSQVLDEEKRGDQVMARVKITEVNVQTSLNIVIWLPEGAGKALIEHEEGHKAISERFYAGAEAAARELAQGWDGKVLTGEGRDSQAASQAALSTASEELSSAYMKRIEGASSRVQELYDEITEHGRNRRVSVDEAIERAFQRWRGKQRQGKEKANSNSSGGHDAGHDARADTGGDGVGNGVGVHGRICGGAGPAAGAEEN